MDFLRGGRLGLRAMAAGLVVRRWESVTRYGIPTISPGERCPVLPTTLARIHTPETERSTGDDAIDVAVH